MQLLYPGFLWGMLAIGAPVAIHLLQLRKPQRILFTNTGFIREVELMTMRRRQLQELLVLLARVLAVIALVLLFCQPFIPINRQVVVTGGGLVNVLVDNSGSMQVLGQSQEQLRQEAITSGKALGRSYGATTRFKLIGQDHSSMQEAAYLTAVANQRASVRGWGNATTRQALQGGQQGPFYIVSDFQKSEMLPQSLQQIHTRENVILVPLVAKPAANIYVDSAWLNDAFVRAQANVALHIRLRNGGAAAIAACPVKVMLGNQQAATFQVSMGAGQATEVIAQIQLPDAKLARGRIITQDAPVNFDNTYYFTLQATAAIDVVEIGEEPATRAAYESEPLFTYAFAKPQAVDYGRLRRTNLVLVRELPRIEAGLREALVGVVRRGGSVVVVPSAGPASHATYHELFKGLGVGGEQWQDVAADLPERQAVLMPNARDPFFRDVFGAQPPRVAMPQVAPVLRLGQAGTDILRLRDGDAFLTQFSSGAGRAYIFAAPFAQAYSDFTTHALFVPVLYRMAMLSYQTDQLPAYRLSTPALALTVPSGEGQPVGQEASYRLVHDSATYIAGQRVQGGQLHLDVPAGMSAPGFYTLQHQGKVITTLAFNAAKQESELAAYSAAELRQLIGPNHPNVQVLENGAQPEKLARFRAAQTGQPLWRYCLLAALGCLLVEGLLLRFGRQRVAARAAMA
ncbi:BatA domain-containing protein [Hymenobacter sp. H14-R3]|uniref:BatA domain-containing protein n=1 Tax=Hymenobacter sp. H14-R3 TaxID=3046308 RepID=UPI0024B94D7D|nr:BatA domain-containing protein [Hymenobacter sp. H14-R3]MDJ0365633.1 BatA domain-containing protein [Hymenobacter sp. H14-R3]